MNRCLIHEEVPSNSKETKLGSGDQEASLSAGKNTGVVLVFMFANRSVSLQLFLVV